MGILARANDHRKAKQFLCIRHGKSPSVSSLSCKWQDANRNAFDLPSCIIESEHHFLYWCPLRFRLSCVWLLEVLSGEEIDKAFRDDITCSVRGGTNQNSRAKRPRILRIAR